MPSTYRVSGVAFAAALPAAALAALAALLAGCAGSSAGTNPPSNPAPAAAMKPAAASLQFTVFTAGQTPGFPSTAGAIDIAAGPNQTIWFTDVGTPAIGRITSDGTVTEFTKGLPAGAKPDAIAAGPDGNIYFSDFRGVVIGRVTPTGTIKEYAATKFTDTFSKGITFGSDGRPWIVGYGEPSVVARLTTRGTIEAHLLPTFFTPDGTLAGDASGNLWFTGQDKHQQAQLLERVASTGKITRLPLHMVKQFLPCCPNEASDPMTIGPGGAPWFTTLEYLKRGTTDFHLGTVQNGAVQLLRLTHAGLSSSAYPSGIAASGNTLWVSGGSVFQSNGALWRFINKTNQTAYPVPYNPISLTVDAAGNPWFTASFSGSPSQIVEVTNAGS